MPSLVPSVIDIIKGTIGPDAKPPLPLKKKTSEFGTFESAFYNARQYIRYWYGYDIEAESHSQICNMIHAYRVSRVSCRIFGVGGKMMCVGATPPPPPPPYRGINF